jgi:hypothetical protein
MIRNESLERPFGPKQAHDYLIRNVGLLTFIRFPQNQTATNTNLVAFRSCMHTDLCCHAFDDYIVSFSSRGLTVAHSKSAVVKTKALI